MKQKNTKMQKSTLLLSPSFVPLVSFVLFVLFVLFALFVLSGFFNKASAATLDSEEESFVSLLNDYRKSQGLSELKTTNPAINGAEYFAEYFANNPDDSDVAIHKDSVYGGPEERGQHYGFYFLSENMGWGYETGQQVFDAWKASSGHQENMTLADARTIGIARVYKQGAIKDGLTTEWYWIADFSDEGVARLIGNDLDDSEFYNSGAKKITVNVKKKNKAGKYKSLRRAQVKVYNRTTGKLIDHDLTDKRGNCRLYTFQDISKVKVKISKSKGKSPTNFYVGGRKIKSRKVTWNKDIKIRAKIRK